MLADRIGILPTIMLPLPNGGQMAHKLICHQAVFCWLYKEAFGQDVAADKFFVPPLSQSQASMGELAKQGKKVKAPKVSSINEPPGTVLIFTDKSGDAKHSCVIRGGHLISGYNQQSWFKTPGEENKFTNHGMGDIKWSPKGDVLLSSGQPGILIAVEEYKAVNFARQKFGG